MSQCHLTTHKISRNPTQYTLRRNALPKQQIGLVEH